MFDNSNLGSDWLTETVEAMTHEIIRMAPVAYNEQFRYMPDGVGPRPGYISYDISPYMIEVLDCFAPWSPVREVNMMKGVQTMFTTLLESVMFYYIGHIKTKPGMFITADKELAKMRVENNIIPMINESDMGHLIRSSDIGNSRKTGKTKDFLQWDGGGSMLYNGAVNATKMRMVSVPLMLKDEIDGWKRGVGDDGNPDKLTDARLSVYWDERKVLRGSTPTTYPSLIHESFMKGDQRRYMVLCFSCSMPQFLKMEYIDVKTGIVGGFQWETENGRLIKESVSYACKNCGHQHYEHDKTRLFALENGAHWKPTELGNDPEIRSYHLPAFYSPYGFRPWHKNVSDYLESYNPKTKKYLNIGSYQEFYNNSLGMPFKVQGRKIKFKTVSGHRRQVYSFGEIPNEYAATFSGSKILFLTCQVDVHKNNLAVAVMGWTVDMRCYVIDYTRIRPGEDEPDCTEINSPVWRQVRQIIDDRRYTADDGTEYGVLITLIDAGYSQSTVLNFCQEYETGVYPILGRKRAAKNQTIKEFDTFPTKLGTTGYRIVVDHYKDRLAPVLRREWMEGDGGQPVHHFNTPSDTTDEQIEELTKETKTEQEDDQGNITHVWYRPGNAANELWDLLNYGHAAVEIWAHNLCMVSLKLKQVEWKKVWEFCEDPRSDGFLNRVTPVDKRGVK